MFELNVAQRADYNPWRHSPTFKAKTLVGNQKRVLDVGCASGYMARELLEQECVTVGIEVDTEAARLARAHCETVIEANIETTRSLPLPYGSFDVILCLDVLEHLARPDLTLEMLKPYLKPNGLLIASIPNIARFEYRARLLLGKFDYEIGGILSKGHLRFFTLSSARQLLEDSGFRIERIEPTGLGSVISAFAFLRTLTAFQFVLSAKLN